MTHLYSTVAAACLLCAGCSRSLSQTPVRQQSVTFISGNATLAGTLFLPYCQATFGNIAVDLFTLRASQRVRDWLDRFGCLLTAVMFLVVGWRAAVGAFDMRRNGETSMLLSFPIWIGYAGILPGVFLAGLVALAQSFGIKVGAQAAEPVAE